MLRLELQISTDADASDFASLDPNVKCFQMALEQGCNFVSGEEFRCFKDSGLHSPLIPSCEQFRYDNAG
jgi:hypothetical protein